MRRWKQGNRGVIVSFALVAAMLLPMSALAREQAIAHDTTDTRKRTDNTTVCSRRDK